MSNIPDDIKQSLFYTVYFTVAHNMLPLFFISIIAILFILILIKPTRSKFLFFSSLVTLVFNLEYKKHIAQPLLKQTLTSLSTEIHHYRFQWLIKKLILKGVAITLDSLSILFFIFGIFFLLKAYYKSKKEIKNPQ